MLEISNSSLTSYRLCPKKYYWSYVRKLKPRRVSSGLTLGSVVHEAFDLYYKGKDMQEVITFIDKTYKNMMATLPPEEQEQAYLDSKTALGMLLNFPFAQMKFDAIESEKEFKVSLMKDVVFIGRVDGLVTKDKLKWIREVKTTGETKSMFENRASVSAQATGYVWGIKKAFNENVVGLLYDGIRKPRLIKRASEDMYEFGQRIYLDYCDAKKKESYFYRYPTYRTASDIDMWLEDTKSTAKMLKKSCNECDFPRNTGSCWVFNNECEYRRICFDKTPDPMVLELLYETKEDRDGRRQGSKGDPSTVTGIGNSTDEISTWQ